MAEPEEPTPPRRTGKLRDLDLTGMLMPWAKGQPVLLRVPASEQWYLPLFTSKTGLERMLKRVSVEWESVKQVEDGHEFFHSITPEVTVMVEPYFTDEGKVRWFEVFTN